MRAFEKRNEENKILTSKAGNISVESPLSRDPMATPGSLNLDSDEELAAKWELEAILNQKADSRLSTESSHKTHRPLNRLM